MIIPVSEEMFKLFNSWVGTLLEKLEQALFVQATGSTWVQRG